MSGMTEMEHVLKASGRPQTSQRARKPPRNWAGQKEKETETKPAPREELWRQVSHTLGSPSLARRSA